MHLLKSKEKKERALGTKLGLKAHRCGSPKCAMVRRPNRPGVHGASRTRGGSEFKTQLAEKQKIRFSYGLNERQMKTIVKKSLAKKSKVSVSDMIIRQLETRLDNALYRLGFSPSRIVARQVISHGHIVVNGRKVNIPSYAVKTGDIISIKESSRSKLLFKDLPNILKGENPENWLSRNNQKIEGTIKGMPDNIETPFNINLVIDFYSR